MSDPGEYFTTIGQAAAEQIEALTQEVERGLPREMPYLKRVGQLRTIRRQAEEAVLRDLIFDPLAQEPTEDLTGRVEDLLGQLPSPEMIATRLDLIRRNAQGAAEREGRSGPALSLEEEMEVQRLHAMLPWVQLDPNSLDDEQLSAAATKLSSFLA